MNADRFWSHVLWRDDSRDSCAIWCGSVNDFGCGRVRVQGRLRSARRVAYQLTYGPIPEDALVKVRCREPACCRPEHLYLWRVTRLTREQTQAIQRRPESTRYLAGVYGVSQARVWQIKTSCTTG